MKKEQYKELFSYLNTTQRAFALKHEIPVSTLSDIVNGRIKSLPKEIIEKLHEEYGIRYEWLVTGKGSMTSVETNNLTADEESIIDELRKDPKLIGAIKSFIKALKENYK